MLKSMINVLTKTFPRAKFSVFIHSPDSEHVRIGYNQYPNVRFYNYIFPWDVSVFIYLWAVFKCTTWSIFYRIFEVSLDKLVGKDQRTLKAYAEADVLLFPSRDVISITYGLIPCFYVFFGIFIATLLNKPKMLYAVQIGPFGDSFKARIAAFLTSLFVKKMDLITLRDSISFDALRKISSGVSRVYVTADPAFLLEPVPAKKARKLLSKEGIDKDLNPLIGIVTSALIYRYGFPEESILQRKRSKYLNLLAIIADHLVEELNATVVLVSHVFEPLENDDRRIAKEVLHISKNKDKIKLILQKKSPEELKGIINLFDMFITTRFHPLIYSTSMCVPTIAIDYTFKMKDLMEKMGCERFLFHIQYFSLNRLIQEIDYLWHSREEIQKKMNMKIKKVRQRSKLNALLVKSLLMKGVRTCPCADSKGRVPP